jgi:sugar phosphate isomerase/epimerase
MKLAFSTNAYTKHPLSHALRGIRAAGFEAVEILADSPHAYPDLIDDTLVRSVRSELDDLGLSVSNVNANCTFGYWRHAPPEPYFEPSLISPDPSHRTDRISLVKKTLDFAAGIGAPCISITSGRCLGPIHPKRAGELFVENIQPILDHADKVGVNVGIECEPGLFVEYATELASFIRQVNHPRLGANLDIGHSVVLGEGIDAPVRTLHDRIWNMHIEDLPGNKHYHMIPGTGTFDWTLLKQSLSTIKYDRCLTVELYTQTENPQLAADESFKFLSDLFR